MWFWPVVGRGVWLYVFSGILRVASLSGGHLSKLGLGAGCSGPFGWPVGFVRRSVSGSTIVLGGGDSVAPDQFPSGDVCLGGSS